jgi:hypothetical protein
MSDFSVFDGALSCMTGVLASAPAQYQHLPAFTGIEIPQKYKWQICTGIPHQGKDGNVSFGPSPEVPGMCASPPELAKMLGCKVCE